MISLSNYIKTLNENEIQMTDYTDQIFQDLSGTVVKINSDMEFLNTNLYPNKKFFQRNCVEKDNVYCLPLGVQDGSQKIILELNEKLNEKTILCSSQYSQYTRSETLPIFDFVTYFEKEPIEKYLENISKSKYVISPHGINPDCFRHWESLYLSAIPITLNNPKLNSFKDLPSLFLNSWDELNEEILINQYETLINKSREKLNIEYWINLIKE